MNRKMLQCCGSKQYKQTEKLQQIGQIIKIKNKKRENKHADRCGNTRTQECCATGSGKEAKIQEIMYRNRECGT
jgi:hypothetical protein